MLSCYLAGQKCTTETNVTESGIPMLSSKKANMKLDLASDHAEIYGHLVDLKIHLFL